MPRKQSGVRLDRAVEEFLEAVRHQVPKPAPNTIRSKERSLRYLIKHTSQGDRTPTHRLTEINFRDAITDLKQGGSDGENHHREANNRGRRTGRGPSSLKADMATYRQFVDFLHHHKWVSSEFSPFYIITRAAREIGDEDVRRRKAMIRVPHSEWPALLDAAAHPRDRLLLTCGLWWARRTSDLAAMQWQHLHLDSTPRFPNGSVELFNVKRGRRVALEPLPIWPELRVEIDRYLAWFQTLHGEPGPEWPLIPYKYPSAALDRFERNRATWLVDPKRPVDPERIGKNIKKVLRVYLGPDVDLYGEGGHTLRRSGGRWVAEQFGISVAQRLLDHQTMSMTRVYVGWSQEDETLITAMRGVITAMQRTLLVEQPKQPEVTQKSEPGAAVIDMFSRKRVA